MIVNNDTFLQGPLGDILAGRPNLGDQVPVVVYRMLQFSIRQVLAEEFGLDFANQMLFRAGKLVGERFCREYLHIDQGLNEFLTELREVLIEQKIGILRVEHVDIERQELLLTVAEDLDCSGLPVVDHVVCDFDEGFLAGIMKVYTGKEFNVREIDCWGMGDRVCRFEVRLA